MHITYAILENMLQLAIDEYKSEVLSVNAAAEQEMTVLPEKMEKLIRANARARVAYFNKKKLNTDFTDQSSLSEVRTRTSKDDSHRTRSW